jgi:hypothetical protein
MQKLINLKMIDFAQYNRERETVNKQLIFGIRIDLEGRTRYSEKVVI